MREVLNDLSKIKNYTDSHQYNLYSLHEYLMFQKQLLDIFAEDIIICNNTNNILIKHKSKYNLRDIYLLDLHNINYTTLLDTYTQLKQIIDIFVNDDLTFNILSITEIKKLNHNLIIKFLTLYQIFQFPTTETISIIKYLITDFNSIEVGSGNGLLADELNIKATDAKFEEYKNPFFNYFNIYKGYLDFSKDKKTITDFSLSCSTDKFKELLPKLCKTNLNTYKLLENSKKIKYSSIAFIQIPFMLFNHFLFDKLFKLNLINYNKNNNEYFILANELYNFMIDIINDDSIINDILNDNLDLNNYINILEKDIIIYYLIDDKLHEILFSFIYKYLLSFDKLIQNTFEKILDYTDDVLDNIIKENIYLALRLNEKLYLIKDLTLTLLLDNNDNYINEFVKELNTNINLTKSDIINHFESDFYLKYKVLKIFNINNIKDISDIEYEELLFNYKNYIRIKSIIVLKYTNYILDERHYISSKHINLSDNDKLYMSFKLSDRFPIKYPNIVEKLIDIDAIKKYLSIKNNDIILLCQPELYNNNLIPIFKQFDITKYFKYNQNLDIILLTTLFYKEESFLNITILKELEILNIPQNIINILKTLIKFNSKLNRLFIENLFIINKIPKDIIEKYKEIIYSKIFKTELNYHFKNIKNKRIIFDMSNNFYSKYSNKNNNKEIMIIFPGKNSRFNDDNFITDFINKFNLNIIL